MLHMMSKKIPKERLQSLIKYPSWRLWKTYFSFSSLVTRAAVFIVLICSIPIAFVGWYFVEQTMDSLTQSAVEQNNKVAERIAGDLSQFMLNRKNFLMVTSGMQEIAGMQPESMQKFLLSVRPYYGGNETFSVVGANGEQIVRTDAAAHVNVGDRDYFKQAMQGIMNFSEPLASKVDHTLTIMGAAPIHGADGSVTGVLVANISLANLQMALEQILAQNPGYITVILDKNRVPIFHQSDSTAVQERRQLEENYYQQAVEQKSGNTVGIVRGQDYLISYRPVNNTEWTVLSLYPKETALQSTYVMIKHSTKVTLLFIALSVLLGLFITRRALLPLKELIAGVRMIEQGDLTYKIKTGRKDEFGYVAQAFANMILSLRRIVQSVKDTSRQLHDSSEQVAAATGHAEEATSQVSYSIQNITGQIVKQTQDTVETDKLMQGLVQISVNVSQSIGQVAAATDQCSLAASQGQAVIQQTINQMQSIKNLVAASSQTVSNLSQSAKKVEQITDVITSIAKQTNLLALNAAIEAARAGDAGRGFAVVAEEVRKLAEQAALSSSGIAGIITEIQNESLKAVEVMGQSLDQVREGVNSVDTSGAAFTLIAETIEKARQQANHITDDTEKQAVICKQVKNALAHISELAEQNTGSAEEIAAVSEEQAASAQNITQAIDGLKAMLQQMEEQVAQFKV